MNLSEKRKQHTNVMYLLWDYSSPIYHPESDGSGSSTGSIRHVWTLPPLWQPIEKPKSVLKQPFSLGLSEIIVNLSFMLGKGSIKKKKKSGIFQIWSDPPTLVIAKNLEKNKNFIVLN